MQPDDRQPSLIYTTCPSQAVAEEIGGHLVEHGLAACVNILPGMVSVYRWQGKIEQGREVVMIIKTRQSLNAPVFAAVRSLHPYDTPALLVLEVADVEAAFGDWIVAETQPSK